MKLWSTEPVWLISGTGLLIELLTTSGIITATDVDALQGGGILAITTAVQIVGTIAARSRVYSPHTVIEMEKANNGS